jgi:hypothetical protein
MRRSHDGGASEHPHFNPFSFLAVDVPNVSDSAQRLIKTAPRARTVSAAPFVSRVRESSPAWDGLLGGPIPR